MPPERNVKPKLTPVQESHGTERADCANCKRVFVMKELSPAWLHELTVLAARLPAAVQPAAASERDRVRGRFEHRRAESRIADGHAEAAFSTAGTHRPAQGRRG